MMRIPRFQISEKSDVYQKYRIGFLGIWYDINPIIYVDVGADIADIINSDSQYWDIDTKNHWPLSILNTEILNYQEYT